MPVHVCICLEHRAVSWARVWVYLIPLTSCASSAHPGQLNPARSGHDELEISSIDEFFRPLSGHGRWVVRQQSPGALPACPVLPCIILHMLALWMYRV